MKKIYTLLFMVAFTAIVRAQIPNYSFENWSNGTPVGWNGVNTGDTLFVQSGDAWQGQYALRMNVGYINGFANSGYLYSGDSGTDGFFPIDSAPGALYGWYIGHIADSGDMLTINSTTTSSGGTAFLDLPGISTATSVYKLFAINYDYVYPPTNIDDSAEIEFGIQNFTGDTLSRYTYFIIDDLYFGPRVAAGITEINPNPVLEQCIPNPATSVANIIYTLGSNSTVNLNLFDITGRQIKTLLANTRQGPGTYKVPTDVSGLPGGIYFYSLNSDGQILTQKLLVAQ